MQCLQCCRECSIAVLRMQGLAVLPAITIFWLLVLSAVTWLGLMPGSWGSLWSFSWIFVQLFGPCLYMVLSMSPGFPSVTSGLYHTTWTESTWSIPKASQLRLLSRLTCGASGTEFKLDLCLHSGLIFLPSFSGLLHWDHWHAADEAAA